MTLDRIKKIGVVGAGTMGQGIAQICAFSGFDVILFDLNHDALDPALLTISKNLDKGIERGKVTLEQKENTLSKIQVKDTIDSLQCDLIIEAIVENIDVKRKLFLKLEEINNETTILASNTSSIPITRIASVLKYPNRFVGMHFFNPAHIMKLVEVISGVATDDKTATLIYDLALKIGKTPVHAQDAPGFIVNRVARNYYVEGLKLLEEGVADINSIDSLLEASGFKMGPFRLMDLIGVDTNFSVTTSMFNAFHQDPKFRPSRFQQQKVDAGYHGRKSGKGFYNYSS
jgi:3-hydroxybutyryl-CoA dehydrogenase